MLLNFKLNIATPKDYHPLKSILKSADERVELFDSPEQAAINADLIVTDVWASMGQEQEQQKREHAFKNYQVNAKVIAQANKDALFMHCLPAHRGEEVATEVIDGKQSVVFIEAENRLHAQKALLEFLICC
jgi:ornithine carbamoyltransferase